MTGQAGSCLTGEVQVFEQGMWRTVRLGESVRVTDHRRNWSGGAPTLTWNDIVMTVESFPTNYFPQGY